MKLTRLEKQAAVVALLGLKAGRQLYGEEVEVFAPAAVHQENKGTIMQMDAKKRKHDGEDDSDSAGTGFFESEEDDEEEGDDEEEPEIDELEASEQGDDEEESEDDEEESPQDNSQYMKLSDVSLFAELIYR